MKPVPFTYVRAESAEHAVETLRAHGDEAKILAGGQSLLPALNMRLLRPGVLVDLNFAADLDAVTEDDGSLRVGALVRQALGRLPRQQRIVLVLRYCEDLPEAEVAAVLGCSTGTVKTHAHRGLRTLRELLGGELPLIAVNEKPTSQRDRG